MNLTDEKISEILTKEGYKPDEVEIYHNSKRKWHVRKQKNRKNIAEINKKLYNLQRKK